MNPGSLDRRVVFLRQPILPGDKRGPFSPFLTVWSSFLPAAGREAVELGRPTDIETGTLRIRDSAAAREITIADRVTIGGREFKVQAIAIPDRRSGTIDITVTTSRLAGR